MKTFLTFLFACFFAGAFAQQNMVDKNIEVGMYIKVNKCKANAKSISSMDLYTKTRYPETDIKIDTLTGEGIFENFFAPGDFDVKRLPCNYSNKKYKIAALRVFELDGKEKRVMICYTGNKLSMIWIELDKALELKEIAF